MLSHISEHSSATCHLAVCIVKLVRSSAWDPIEDIPDVGDFHMTSVQVFIVRDSYIAKRPPPEWGGYRGGDLKRGEMAPHTWGRKMCMGAG